nr:hypothetical protein [Tanacetum cinerariifolium]
MRMLHQSQLSSECIPTAEYFATASTKEFPLLSFSVARAEEFALLMMIRITLSQRHLYLNQRRVLVILEMYYEVIKFGDSYQAPPEETGNGSASKSSAKKKGRTIAITIEDMQKRRNDVKVRTTLLLALPDEHQLRFSKYDTAQELWGAILKTFGGNKATKKTKKNQLKQQYGNFKGEGSETLEQTFNRLQAIVSHLEDDLDTMSLDDVYNHLKVYKLEVQKKSETNSQNMAFISSSNTRSGKGEVHTASVPTTSTQVSTASTDVAATSISHDTVCAYIASQSNGSQIKYEDITQIDEDDNEEMDIKWNITLLSMRADMFWKRTGKKITIQRSDVAGFDKSKVECFNCHKMGHFARECRAPRSQDRGKRESYRQGPKEEEQALKALMAIDGIGWDWSYMANEEENHALVADEEVLTKFDLLAKSSSSYENEVESRLVEFKIQEIKFCEKIRGLERDVEVRNNKIENLMNVLELVKKEKEGLDNKLIGFEYASKDLDTLLGSQRTNKNKEGIGYNVVPPPAQVYSPPKKDMSWTGLLEFADDTVTDYSRPTPSIDSSSSNISDLQNINFFVSKPRESSSSSMSKPMIKFVKAVDSPGETRKKLLRPQLVGFRDLNKTLLKKNNIDDKGYWDSGCSWHMTGNISYLSDYEPYDGGYVSFGQGGGKITGKGIIKTGKLEFENVYFVKELKTKDETSGILRNFIIETENLKDLKVKIIRGDNGGEFKNKEMNEFFTKKGIKREFSNARTPQQNGVAERRNRILIEAARTMLADAKLPVTFWAEAVNRFLRPFGCHVMILNTLDHLEKFDAKRDEGYFVRYSMSSKAFRVFNKRTKKVEENIHVDFLENKLIEKGAGPNWLFDIDTLTNSMNYVPVVVVGTSSTNISGTKDVESQDMKKDVSSLRYIALPNWFHEAHMESSNSDAQDACNADAPESSGISKPTATLKIPTAEQIESLTMESEFPTVSSPVLTVFLDTSPETSCCSRLISKEVISQEETPSLDNALTLSNRFEDTIRVEADLSNMESSIPARIRHIGTKWVLKNKKDKRRIVIRNKARLVAQGHTQEKGTDYEEVVAPVARIEAIRLFLSYASFMGFTVFQMDVKSAFLYGTIDEEVYMMQPPRFQDPEFPDRVYKVEKAMYGLHQAPRARYGTLSKYLLDNGFQRDVRSANTPMDKENPWGKDGPGKDVELHPYRSMIGSLMYLIASRPDIMFAVCACARHQVTPKECHLHAIKRIFRYLKGHPKLGLWYPKESPFDLVAYLKSDYGGATQDRKSITGDAIDAQVARELEEEFVRDNQRLSEQLAKDSKISRLHAEEELKIMIEGLDRSNEMIVKNLHEYKQSAADLSIGEKIELINELVKYQDHHAKIIKYQA